MAYSEWEKAANRFSAIEDTDIKRKISEDYLRRWEGVKHLFRTAGPEDAMLLHLTIDEHLALFGGVNVDEYEEAMKAVEIMEGLK